MATGAGMVRRIGMDAPGQSCRLIGVAGIALDRRHLLRMGIILDGGVAIGAFQAAVDAGAKLLPVHADAVPRCVLQTRVSMAGQTIAVRLRHAGQPPQPEARDRTRGRARWRKQSCIRLRSIRTVTWQGLSASCVSYPKKSIPDSRLPVSIIPAMKLCVRSRIVSDAFDQNTVDRNTTPQRLRLVFRLNR